MVLLKLCRQLGPLRPCRLNERAENRVRGLSYLRPIVHTPLRMPLHGQHEMFGSGSFQGFDDSIFRGTSHHSQPFAYRVRGLMMRRIHGHRPARAHDFGELRFRLDLDRVRFRYRPSRAVIDL